MVQALIDLEASQVSSYDSISNFVTFHDEPDPVDSPLPVLTGYDDQPGSLQSVIECFLRGQGTPHEELASEIGLEELVTGLGETLNDPGTRVRLFLLAATSSRGLLSDVNPAVSTAS